MSNTYTIVVPSYLRAGLCNSKTLTMLKKNNIPKDIINVYVANNDEYTKYMEELNPNLYGNIIIGVEGINPQRQFIVEQFSEGAHLVFMDDDVEAIDLSLSEIADDTLDNFISWFQDNQAFIWGVYPVLRPCFRNGRKYITECLSFIAGPFFGIINRPNNNNIKVIREPGETQQKDDVER